VPRDLNGKAAYAARCPEHEYALTSANHADVSYRLECGHSRNRQRSGLLDRDIRRSMCEPPCFRDGVFGERA